MAKSTRKSIIQREKVCYICGTPVNLQLHHVWHGTANRKKADEDGLVVWLCVTDHVLLHDRGEHDKELMAVAQEAWEKEYGSREEFRRRYGKSIL